MIFEKTRVVIALLLLHSIALTAQTRKEGVQPLFSINGKPVGAEEFLYLYRKNHQHKPEDFTREKIDDYLDLFINYKLKVEEALARGMDTTAAFKKEFQTYRDELLKPYMPDSKVLDSMVLMTYERLKQEVNASHILIRLEPEASAQDTLDAWNRIMALRARAVAGEDFGVLAAENSEEPGAGSTGGNLGYFTAMQMVFPFEQAAYLTPPGKISAPVRTQFGYHIVKVIDRQPSRGEVEVSHIMVRTQGDEDTEARTRIFEIHDKLQKGMEWDELCRQYSEDPASKDRGGRLRPFGVGAMASVPQFQEMAFSLREKGDISDPVQTQFGWHILRLESKIPLPSFEELKPALTQRVARDERVTISRTALRERMREQFNFTEIPETGTRLHTQARDLFATGTDRSGSLMEQTLFTMKSEPYTVGDFVEYVEDRKKGEAAASSAQELDRLYTDFVDHIQIGLLEEKVKRESPDYRWLLKEYYEGILLFEIMEKEVWNKAMEDSAGQRKYFDEHRKKYNAGERMVGKIYQSSNKGHLQELQKMLEGRNDGGVSEFVSTHRIRVDSGAFEQKDRAIFSRISWSPGIHLAEQSGTGHLLSIEKILPSGPQTFEEARAAVISDYQTFLEDAWISELKRKFAVKVDKKAKKRAIDELIDDRS